MGKNPNANREKKSKFTNKEAAEDTSHQEELQDEAARRGIEVWELEKERAPADSDSEEDDGADADETQINSCTTKPVKKPKKSNASASKAAEENKINSGE